MDAWYDATEAYCLNVGNDHDFYRDAGWTRVEDAVEACQRDGWTVDVVLTGPPYQVLAHEPDDVSEYYGPHQCDGCGQLVEECECSPNGPILSVEVEVKFINVYLVRRCYGGPEEGGWWFDAGELLRTVVVAAADAGERAKALEAEYSNDGRRPLFSVLSTGEYRVSVDDKPGRDWPVERPHYE